MANPTAEEAILTKLAQAPSFHPSGAKLFVPDWTLDPGDVVTVQSDGESYNVPIYSLDLSWNGACRADIQSTGNQQREPLSALRRKEYQTGRRGYGLAKQVEEEVDEQYQHWTTENNVYKESVYKIMGVELNEDGTVKYIQATDEQGNPIYDEHGNPVWELDEAGNPKPVYNPDSDGSISGKVRTTAQDLESLYTVTGVASLPSGESTLYSYTSKIKQTADAVSSEVTAARGGETSLSSKITQLSGQIGLVVEKKNNKDVINRAAIVAAINEDDKATVTISADQIDLQGYVTADELYVDGQLSAGKTIYAGNLHVYEDAEIVGNISTSADSELTLGIVEATSLSATDTLYIGETEITEDLLNSFLTSGIVSASVENNVLTLTDSDGNEVNFSKATSVNGEWGSNQQGQPTGVFTVTATQTNRNTTTGQDETTTVGTVLTSITQAGHWGNTSNQEDPNTYYQSTNATINTSQQLHTVKTAEINAAGRFYAGKNSVGLAPMSYTAFQGENYPASQTIYTDTTGRTDASGDTDNLHRDITLSLDADSSYVYMKHGSDIIARINNPGGGTITVDSWSLTHQTGTDYTYKASVNVNGTPYESGNLDATEAYNNGWTGAYQSVGIFPTAVADLVPGGSPITIYAQAKATSGSAKSNVASVQVKARSLNLKNETFTTNDTYPVPDGYDGYGTVTVNVHDGGGGGDYYATFLDNITLESTDISDSVTKYSIANYSDGHRDPAANTRVVIDASRVYSAGVTAGLGGVVDVVKSNWNLGYCTFTPSAGSGQSQEVLLNYAPVKPGFYSANGEATINILDDNTSVNLPIRLVLARRQFGLYNYACLFKNGDTLTQGNVLAKFQLDGSAVISDVASILQNGRITYQDTDKKIANIPVTAYDGDDNALLSTTITTDMSDTWDAGYETGFTEGTGVPILSEYSTTIDSNNTTITLLPSDKGNYNVMASAKVKIQVPVNEGIQGATLLASTDSDSAWSGWQLNDYTTLSKKYGFIRITGKDGSTYSYGVDANGVYDAGVSAGAGVQIETSKSYGSTVTETGTYTITPSSGYAAMKKATFSVSVPTIPRLQTTLAYGTASIGSHTVYPDEDYDAMKKVTFTVPNVTVETQRNQPTTGVTTTNIKVGNNIKVIVKFGNATVHQQIFAATT